MKIAIGNDRKGLLYKAELVKWLERKGYKIVNVGTDEDVPCDYPIYGEKVARLVADKKCDRGIVICSSGVGISIAANKVNGIRCGLAYCDEAAKLIRQHNDANVIAFGQSYMDLDDVKRRTDIFLNTDFIGNYHQNRIDLITKIEHEMRNT